MNCCYTEHSDGFECTQPEQTTFTKDDAVKLEYIYRVALDASRLLNEVAPQIAPILAGLEKNPMLKMFLKK